MYTIEKIEEMLTSYVANEYVDFDQFKEKKDDISYLFSEFEKEWNALPCDSEGFTSEQNKEADTLIKKYANEIIKII